MSQTPHPDPLLDQRYQKLLEHLGDHVALMDIHGKILYSNAAVERLLGYSVEEYAGVGVRELLHPDDLTKAEALLRSLLAEPGATAAGEFRSRHKQGHYLWLEVTVTNQLDDPDIAALVAVSRDMSERQLRDQARFTRCQEQAGRKPEILRYK